jgi:phosphopantetheinyl transferase
VLKTHTFYNFQRAVIRDLYQFYYTKRGHPRLPYARPAAIFISFSKHAVSAAIRDFHTRGQPRSLFLVA